MTAPTNTYKRNTGPVQRTQGSISGTYTAASDVSTTTNATMAAGVTTITLGFVPTRFKITNATQRISYEWFDNLSAGNFIKTVANGTVTLETSGMTVSLRTGAGGSTTQAGGSADTAASGVVSITNTTIITDNDNVVWVAEG